MSYKGGGLSPEQEKNLENGSAEDINENIKTCGDLIRKLKFEKAAKDQIQAEVAVLLKLKGFYKSKTGQDWKPGAVPEKKVETLEQSAAEALDMKIKSCGDLIRKLKAEKASKEQIGAEVKVLLSLKEAFKEKTGKDWKPADAKGLRLLSFLFSTSIV